MSLLGKAKAEQQLRGKINGLETIKGYSAYEIALIHGFEGTEEEWLASLKAEVIPRLSSVTLLASAWEGVEGLDGLYSQVVAIEGVTEHSKVDLLPSVEQLAIFHNKDVTFVTENEDGVVTVFAIGEKPTNDYTMQVQITEVEA
jgi:hypothetical protein